MSPIAPDGVNRTIAMGDLNGDGIADAVVTWDIAAGLRNLSVALGARDGTFKPLAPLPLRLEPDALQLVDVDKDGRLDVVLSARTPGTTTTFLQVMLGKGDGTLAPAAEYPINDLSVTSLVPIQMVPAPHPPDLFLSGVVNGANVGVLMKNLGDGTFGAPTLMSKLGPRVLSADLNHDGVDDLVVVDATRLTLFLNDGYGQLLPKSDAALPSQSLSPSVAVGDLDGNGTLDIAVATTGPTGESPTIALAFTDGTGMVTNRIDVPSAFRLDALVVRDFDGDGRADILAHAPTTLGHTVVYQNLGQGQFAQSQTMAGVAIAAFESNGDNRLDLAYADLDTVSIGVRLNTCAP
jgi:hypothetical protein